MTDLIKDFIEKLPTENIQQCYTKNAIRHADDAVTAKNRTDHFYHRRMYREFKALAKHAARKP
jgi:hypothetical protein